MQIEAQDGTIVLKKLGRTFAARDAERAAELLRSFMPFSQLVLDFTKVRECDDGPFLSLMQTLQSLVGVRVVLRGLTRHQARLLAYLGTPGSRIEAQA